MAGLEEARRRGGGGRLPRFPYYVIVPYLVLRRHEVPLVTEAFREYPRMGWAPFG